MYYKDLSKYTYSQNEPYPYVLNIGWLDITRDFPTGQVSASFLDMLWIYCCNPINLTFGYHDCTFCDENFGVYMSRNGSAMTLGSTEIRVFGANEVVYAAPNMIYHYIVTHQYLPPDQFIQAILDAPVPSNSADYQRWYSNF